MYSRIETVNLLTKKTTAVILGTTLMLGFMVYLFVQSGINLELVKYQPSLISPILVVTIVPALILVISIYVLGYFLNFAEMLDDEQIKFNTLHLGILILTYGCLFFFGARMKYNYFQYISYKKVDYNCFYNPEDLKCVESYFRCGKDCQIYLTDAERLHVMDLLLKKNSK
jgi:hypothetical protein